MESGRCGMVEAMKMFLGGGREPHASFGVLLYDLLRSTPYFTTLFIYSQWIYYSTPKSYQIDETYTLEKKTRIKVYANSPSIQDSTPYYKNLN